MKKLTPSLASDSNEIDLEFLPDISQEVLGRPVPTEGSMSIVPTEPAGLSPAQIKAIESLASGHSVIDSAAAAGVGRATLYRWLKGDAAFVAAYNAWQRDIIDTARGRLLSLSNLAVTAVEKSLERADAKTAIKVLLKLGVLDRPVLGPTDPAEVERQQSLQLRKAKSALAKAEARAEMDEMLPL